MDKPQIIGIGLNGLVGSRISQLLSDKYEFVSLSRSTGTDITKKETLGVIKKHKDANFVLHMAAKSDVDGCERDKDLGEEGEAWRINVIGTQNVVDFCHDFGKKIIYFSTDFVFDGEKPQGEYYKEEDQPEPINWYGQTKFEGEKVIEKSGADYMIIRIADPYRARYDGKKDFVRIIWERLKQGLEVESVTDHIFCPTFIDDIAYGVDKLIENDAVGIYHMVGGQALTPYDAVMRMVEAFGLSQSLVSKTTRAQFFKDRALRPFNSALRNDKITKLGIEMKGFEEGLLEIKSQLA